MTIRAEDLPADVRRKLGIDTTKTSKRSRAGTGMGAPCPGTCGACGQQFDRYTAFERHSRPGHRRWAINLNNPGGTP